MVKWLEIVIGGVDKFTVTTFLKRNNVEASAQFTPRNYLQNLFCELDNISIVKS